MTELFRVAHWVPDGGCWRRAREDVYYLVPARVSIRRLLYRAGFIYDVT